MALFGIAACARLDYLPPIGGGGGGRGGAGGFPGAQAPGIGGPGAGGFGPGGPSGGRQIPILRFDDKNDGEGTYSFAYETGNGIQAQEQGDARGNCLRFYRFRSLICISFYYMSFAYAPGDGTRAQGGFSYTSPDGQQVHISYTADENGFVPQGSHIPTPPPIPEEIQKAIQQNLADEARGIVDDGQYREDFSGQYRGGAGAGAGFGAGVGAGVGAGAGAGAGAGFGAGSRLGGTSYSQNGGYRY